MDYEEAIKDAKRWTLLMIREGNRKETEDDIVWEWEPALLHVFLTCAAATSGPPMSRLIKAYVSL
jgi:hypothetical protein